MIKSKFLSVNLKNTLLAILKVTDAIRNVRLAGGQYHRFPLGHLPPPGLSVTISERNMVLGCLFFGLKKTDVKDVNTPFSSTFDK